MNKSTCCIQECESKVFGKLLCSKHYTRLVRHGSTKDPVRVVAKCAIVGCSSLRSKKAWCGTHYSRIRKAVSKEKCALEGCSGRLFALFLCQVHYHRLRNTGTTNLRIHVQSKCRMPSCESPARKNRWCSMHKSRIDRNGSPFDKDQKWVVGERSTCIVCGLMTVEGNGLRRYCSSKCAAFFHLGPREHNKLCVACGGRISLDEVGRFGRRKYSSASYCDNCRAGVNLRAYVPVLAEAKGTDCGICSNPIDMELKYPDPMSRSVDHIFPRSLGGTEDLENLQLAHLNCNNRKQNRLDYVAS